MVLIAQIALGVIIGGLTIALLVMGFFVWNSRQKNERLAFGLLARTTIRHTRRMARRAYRRGY